MRCILDPNLGWLMRIRLGLRDQILQSFEVAMEGGDEYWSESALDCAAFYHIQAYIHAYTMG